MYKQFKEIYSLSVKRMGYIFYFLLFCSFFSVLFELIGITLFLPLFNIVDNGFIGDDNISRILDHILNFFNLNITLLSILFLILVCFTFKFIFLMIISFLEVSIITNFQKNIQIKIISLLENAKNDFQTNKNTGTIANLISRETDRYTTTIRNIIRACVTIITTLVFTSYLFISNFIEMAILFIFIIFLFILLKPLLNITKKYSLMISKNYAEVQNLLIEMINNFNYLKATENTKKIKNFINIKINNLNKNQKNIYIISRFFILFKEPVGIIILITILFYFVELLNQPIASVIVISIIFYKVSQNLFDIQNNLQRINSSLGGIYTVEKNLQNLKNNQNNDIGKIKANFQNIFYFNNITVKYNNNTALQNINFEILPRKTIGIIGPSGSGKSTILNLLLGLVKPSNGNLYLGNIEYKDLDFTTLRSQVGYVSQETSLFKGSIADNINYLSSQPINTIKMNNIINQIGFDNLNLRLNEDIGEQGKKLSGGQKQRLSIIRELYKDPKLLIFDEATSALDSESESYFRKTINSLKGKKTIIIITHNISSVRNCDTLILLEKGKIKTKGRFKDLISKDDLFNKLVNLQNK